MKQAHTAKLSSIIESTQSSEEKIKSIETLIKQFRNHESVDWDEPTIIKQMIVQKKISPNQDPVPMMEKTSKIKKNKKSKKKKINLPAQLQIQPQKVLTHQLCSCCAKKFDNSPTIDQYESDEQDSMDDPAYINSILSSLVENLLECFYDEIDKIIVRLMKDVEQHHSRTFIRLIRKLSEIYEDFDLSLIEEIERQFEGQNFTIPMKTNWSVPEQFKTYIISKFPLLKDFIQNFNMKQLDEKQLEQFVKLRSKNALIQCLYMHMEQIMTKRLKKKNKKQLQKLNKSKSTNLKQVLSEPQNLKAVLEKFSSLQINESERSQCYFDNDRFLNFKDKIKGT